MSNHTILVSGYNDQISRMTVHQSDSGPVLEEDGVWDVDRDMTWLQVEGDMVYAAHEVQSYGGAPGGAISRWKMTGEGMNKLEMVILPTVSPAHLLVSLELGLAFAANYGGHSFTAVRMDNGRLGDIAYHETFGAGCRDASHPHQTVVYGPWVWVVDLGCDTIWHYKVDNKKVVKLGKTSVKAGLGPRHMVVHNQKKLVFLVGELLSLVEVYR
jgi:6-phosphogluconolactonase